MQRYHPGGCASAVSNSAIGGASARDSTRSDSASLPANYSLNSRRQPPLTAYKLKCDKQSLNSRLGPPDFHPQTPNCPEETLTKEYVQAGYRETVEGLEESREITLSQAQSFSKPVVFKCKEAIRKCLRAINESRAQKRKAGQVYGVPLTDSLLTKPGVFPEQRPCSEDFCKKWIEGLSQPHKRLRTLADHVPHGYRKRALFEVLIRNNVPLLRATWFIKVSYLNQVRPGSGSNTSGTSDKAQLSRTEIWTKDVIEYLQYLLDEFLSKNNAHSTPHIRDRSSQILYSGSIQRSDPVSTVLDAEDSSLHFKWWYMVRLLQWHYSEGLVLPSLIIDWVLRQLQDKESLEIVQLLLPIIYGVLETVVLSQTYVRNLVGVAVRFIREPSPGGSDLVENSRKAYTTSALVEMLRYLVVAVPDTFVALDCFPLPSCVISHVLADGSLSKSTSEDVRKIKAGSSEASFPVRSKGLDAQYQSLALDTVVSSIQKRADNLAKAARPGYPGRSVAKVVQALDKSRVHGDVRGAYKCLFEDLCEGAVNDRWMAEVSPCLRSSLKWIGIVDVSFACSVFLLCEWATCDFRDFRTGPPDELKFTGRKDFSQVYIAIRLLKQKIEVLQNSPKSKSDAIGVSILKKSSCQQSSYSVRTSAGELYDSKNNVKKVDQPSKKMSCIFESPGPLHDIIVCWIDQHETCKGDGFQRLQLLVVELVRAGIFYPQAYVRQLMVSGVMEMNGSVADVNRRKRHDRILKQLPGIFVRDALEEAGFADGPQLLEAMHNYSNERRIVLGEVLCNSKSNLLQKLSVYQISGKGGACATSFDQKTTTQSSSNVSSNKHVKADVDIEELKEAISTLLQLPNSPSKSADTGLDDLQPNAKRSSGSLLSKIDVGEGTPGCEECKRAKRQKVGDERSSAGLQGHSPAVSDDGDCWWMKKGFNSVESVKVAEPPPPPPLKSNKQVSKTKQKVGRKTTSLAQLAASRIEGSQGASTSHVCDNKVSCPHHRTVVEGETPKSLEGLKTNHYGDIVSIGKALKRLRFVEKRSVSLWLMAVVRQAVEDMEKMIAKAGQLGRGFTSVDDKNGARWKLGEDELSSILYLMDVSNDLVLAIKFILWLLPKVMGSPSSTMHAGSSLLLPRNVESQVCEVGETFLVSALRRYENILIAQDLVPEALSSAMHRASAVIASNGRVSGSPALVYARFLLKRYGKVVSVVEWEKNFKATCDKRLVSELESGRSGDGELTFPLGVPAGVEDLDDFFRQKISGVRLSRVGANMRDVVQRNLNIEDVLQYLFGKDRKAFVAGTPKAIAEKWDDACQLAQKVISDLMDCIRQTGGAAQEGDPSLVSSAVSAIAGSIGATIVKLPDFRVGNGFSNSLVAMESLNMAKRILRVHITCLCLLKDALGERQTRVFEVALANEASAALAGVFAPPKGSRNQFQSSPDSHDSNSSTTNETVSNSAKLALARATKISSAVSALIIGAVVHGVTSLERMVTVFRLKEGLDIVQFIRSTRSSSNGSSRSLGAFKMDSFIEVYVHWFRLLVGNCRTVSDGLVVELLGEPSIVALSRMQRMLPVSLVFPPAYSIFAFVLWRPFILSASLSIREDINQLYNSLSAAINDAIRHLPFRDACLRDSQGFYELVAADNSDIDFATILELGGSDLHAKSKAFVPLRARLFLNALIDCKMPEDGSSRVSGHGESKNQFAEAETKLLKKLVHILDTLQPAKLHWQWIELRLLLNEQTLIEKLETHDITLKDAIRASSPSSGKAAVSDNENNFIQIILTRLLVRPDAASLFSDVVHLFGRSLEDYLLLQAKWFLGGSDVLLGRKTIRQRLINIAESKGHSTKALFWKPWGWFKSGFNQVVSVDKKKFDAVSLEEGEVADEVTDSKRSKKGSNQTLENEGVNATQQHVTERALIDLLRPCIDQSSDDSRNTFASDLIKQLNNIEQQISAVTCGMDKQAGPATPGTEGPVSKGNSRKAIKGGSPGLARRAVTNVADSTPPSPAALRASMSLRLQLLLRLLPAICADGEPSGRNMRHTLALVILRLLGSRIVHEDADLSFNPFQIYSSKREMESSAEAVSAVSADLSGGSLFDWLLLVLHGLLSSYPPSWLRMKSALKSTNESTKDTSGFDRELTENLQNDLDRMQLPNMIRWRIQTAMPVLLPSVRCSVNCQPPSIPNSTLACLQPFFSTTGSHPGNLIASHRNQISSVRSVTNTSAKSKSFPAQDQDTEIDPWTLLEDSAGSGQSSSNSGLMGSGDYANLRATSWLKGAVRVRRKDLTYIGAVDDDS